MWVRLKMGVPRKKKRWLRKYEKNGVSSSSRQHTLLCEILGYPQLLGHHAGHNIIRSVSPHRVPQSLIFTCQASQNWECAVTFQHHALETFKKKTDLGTSTREHVDRCTKYLAAMLVLPSSLPVFSMAFREVSGRHSTRKVRGSHPALTTE